ncbi:hypothetical protein [Streptomyces sp. 3N207]|uniref:hypothetical protein n=1 Tax=Streptomyces sp. 3N207 TaxID=3457417 RepID=UPI003FD1AECD
MAVEGRLYAMLAFQAHPEGGQVIGKYTLVSFSDSGSKYIREKKDFNGRGSDGTFEFDGLSDYGVVRGTLSGDRTRLTFDSTFSVKKQWTIISSTDVFESTVKKYAKRFDSCSKKQEYNPCENVA